jgi:hypothetical protein
MMDERSELGRQLSALRWQTPERRRLKVERLAAEVQALDEEQFEEFRALVEDR